MSAGPPEYHGDAQAALHSNSQSSSLRHEEKASVHDEITPAPAVTTGGHVATEEFVSEAQRAAQAGQFNFRWASLWEPAVVNPLNGKSYTLPLFRIWDPYSVAFWMATLGFFSAFFSWFAFAPLVTEAVKVDLKLTQDQITNSNLASLGGTALVRFAAGTAVDRYGPRKVMAVLLCLGAIPSALVPTISNIGGLETIRFFISILGGTFVPTQAWTTTFFDKTIVGTANALSGGWGNLGGGVTPSVMIGLYERLHKAGLSPHLAWRICFLVLPVPLLFLIALTMMIIGKDHPAGKWSQRHQLPGTAVEVAQGGDVHLDSSEAREYEQSQSGRMEKGPAKGADFRETGNQQVTTVDTSVSEPLTMKSFVAIITDLRVWMVALCYMTTFGLETSLDAALPQLINGLFASPTFTAVDAAFVASTYGLCNLYARPLGGIICDLLYHRFRHRGLGVRAKVIFLIATAVAQGVLMIGLGFYVDSGKANLGGVIGFMVALATTGFAANGAAYAVYGHLRPKNIGVVAGMVGGFGNIGGLWFTLIYKYQPGLKANRTLGRKFWIAGIFNTAIILPFAAVPLGDAN
ncbi:MFS general substrate transporter [Acaromyces ingoldii]|uniref:MFS general substrate transporter n=1 Tax=Acaromyces ingoldii TaxID=215250 RepID=A0A316YUT7_9BASI|nr:MFS general substrate transporter [Acaromyces ingoldii]PWN91803.1 MFS general substrate transporter [Acaromyces ingoldii]